MKLKNGVPCNHTGCLNHITHPCERCGRIAGRTERVTVFMKPSCAKCGSSFVPCDCKPIKLPEPMCVISKCHMCENPTEFFCCDCDQPVCEDCCVMPTYMNQIEYTICTECGDGREVDAMEEREREWEQEAKLKAKKRREPY